VIVRALYPSRRHLSSKVRMLVDCLASELSGHRQLGDPVDAVMGLRRG
jgi:hypothetical protein